MNAAGNVAGLMPHPERAAEALLGSADGLPILRSLVEAAGERATAGGFVVAGSVVPLVLLWQSRFDARRALEPIEKFCTLEIAVQSWSASDDPGLRNGQRLKVTFEEHNASLATLIGASGAMAFNPGLYAKLPYDPVKSFAPVALVARVPNVLVVNPAVPARDVQQLIALAKAELQGRHRGGGSGPASPVAGKRFPSGDPAGGRHLRAGPGLRVQAVPARRGAH